ETYERSVKNVEDGNMTGQFDSVREFAGKKKNELSEIEFVLPLNLSLGPAFNKIIEQSREKGEEHKKGPKTYTSWKVLSQKSWPTEKKK
ncbi:20545_t:CDS:1, partial [Cetraspora pellucida]